MELFYRSTRNENVMLTASEAILQGLSDEGGLFVPERIPVLNVSLSEIAGMDYQETAYMVMKQFLTDFTEEELKSCIRLAYDAATPDMKPRLGLQMWTAHTIWSCSMARLLPLRIWHFPFCRI